MFVAHAGHVNVRFALLVPGSLHLLRRNDDLAALRAVHALDRVVQQADRPHHLPRLLHELLLEVGGVADHHLRAHRVALRHHAGHLLVLVLDAIDLSTPHSPRSASLVQNEHAAVQPAEAREALGQSAQAVQRVDERRLAVRVHRVAVELDRAHRLRGRLVEVVVVQLQRHRVAREVLRVLVQAVFLVQLAHRHAVQRNVLVRVHAVLSGDLHLADARKEALVLHLLEEAQKRSAHGFLGGRRHLVGLLGLSVIHEAAIDALELQIVGDASDVQDIRQLAARHEELGDQIDAVVTAASQLLLGFLAGLLVELLVQLLSVRS